eukprot:366155-Chlamydomonas_euryale.AAC.6
MWLGLDHTRICLFSLDQGLGHLPSLGQRLGGQDSGFRVVHALGACTMWEAIGCFEFWGGRQQLMKQTGMPWCHACCLLPLLKPQRSRRSLWHTACSTTAGGSRAVARLTKLLRQWLPVLLPNGSTRRRMDVWMACTKPWSVAAPGISLSCLKGQRVDA